MRTLEMENKSLGPAQDWLTIKRPAIVPREKRERASILAVPRQVISFALGKGEDRAR
jgi:hypothetical protein